MALGTIDKSVRETRIQPSHENISNLMLVGKEMRDFTVLRQSRLGLRGLFRHLRTEEPQLEFLVMEENEEFGSDIEYFQISPYHALSFYIDSAAISLEEKGGKRYGILKVAGSDNKIIPDSIGPVRVDKYLLPFMTTGDVVKQRVNAAEIHDRLSNMQLEHEAIEYYRKCEKFFDYICSILGEDASKYGRMKKREVHKNHSKYDVFGISVMGEKEVSRSRKDLLSRILIYSFGSPGDIRPAIGSLEGIVYTGVLVAGNIAAILALPDYDPSYAIKTSVALRVINQLKLGGAAGVTGSIYGALCWASDKIFGKEIKSVV